jgi:DNA-binding transcriptional ArsR family regulator/catechol 2,3-dioxygenase-like lactoylglutathione lyase family enzyme
MHPFSVVADPVRRRIVEVLAGGERTAGEVVEVVGGEFGISQSAVSQQLKVLRDHGFARVRAVGARRIYALDPNPSAVDAMDEWLRAVGAFWADRLEDLASEVEGHSAAPAAASRTATSGHAVAPGRLASVARTVRDVAESVAFYGDLLGMSCLDRSAMDAVFDIGGVRLLLLRRDPPSREESVLSFAVRDLPETVASLRASGVEVRDRRSVVPERGDATANPPYTSTTLRGGRWRWSPTKRCRCARRRLPEAARLREARRG